MEWESPFKICDFIQVDLFHSTYFTKTVLTEAFQTSLWQTSLKTLVPSPTGNPNKTQHIYNLKPPRRQNAIKNLLRYQKHQVVERWINQYFEDHLREMMRKNINLFTFQSNDAAGSLREFKWKHEHNSTWGGPDFKTLL